MRKIMLVPELPKTFIYLTETHEIRGTGETIDKKVMDHERLHSKKR
jgi:hypothetical protein